MRGSAEPEVKTADPRKVHKRIYRREAAGNSLPLKVYCEGICGTGIERKNDHGKEYCKHVCGDFGLRR